MMKVIVRVGQYSVWRCHGERRGRKERGWEVGA